MILNVNSKCEIYPAGTEIYYTGDSANIPGYGVITEIIDNKYNISLNDGRIFRMVYHISFGTKPGYRFMTKSQKEEINKQSIIYFIKRRKTEDLKNALLVESYKDTWDLIKEELKNRT